MANEFHAKKIPFKFDVVSFEKVLTMNRVNLNYKVQKFQKLSHEM